MNQQRPKITIPYSIQIHSASALFPSDFIDTVYWTDSNTRVVIFSKALKRKYSMKM